MMSLNNAKHLMLAYGLAIFMLIAIAVASLALQISIPTFTRDVTSIAEIHPFSGILSNLGIYLWCISASACFFAAMVLRAIKQAVYFSFLFSSALLSTYLMLDDAFLFHEVLSSEYFGISEQVVILILGIAVLVYLKCFMHVILKTKYVTLILAFAFLSSSVVLDVILEPWLQQLGDWEFFIEDGAKWLGIVSWTIYYIETSFRFVVHPYELTNKTNALGQ